jgi:hypothetical protein
VRPEGLGNLRKFIHLIRSQTRDLPASIIVPKPLRYECLQYFHKIQYATAMKRCSSDSISPAVITKMTVKDLFVL